jgi:hypothetical protein
MKTFITDIIPKIQRFSQKLDDLTKLTNQHWVSLGDLNHSKRIFIFRPNNQLLISDNGIVEKGAWEYLGNQSLLIETKAQNYLLKHAFFDENIIALKLDSTDSYAFFVNETKYQKELNNIDDILKFLDDKYLKNNKKPTGLGSNAKGVLNENISYKVLNQFEMYDFLIGNHIVYELKFMNGLVGKIYRGNSTGRFFYLEYMFGKVYCKDFKDAATRLFMSLMK